MKLKYKFESVNMDNEIILVPVGEDATKVQGILKLNAEGKEIITLLETETTESKMLDALITKYENDRNILAGYIRNVLEYLRANNLLEE